MTAEQIPDEVLESDDVLPESLGKALVITVSTRAAAGIYEDTAGPVLVEGLRRLGFEVTGPNVVADGVPLEKELRKALLLSYEIILTSGGTGIHPNDHTPEITAGLLEREIPGIAEAIRSAGQAKGVPTAVLSRGRAGVTGETLIVNLAGSRGAAKDGIAVLSPILKHAVEQLRGGDH